MRPHSRTFGYAIRLVRCLNDPGGSLIRVDEVARSAGISRPYLSKIVHILGQQGLIKGRRGHHGGVVLTRPKAAITLEQLSASIDGTAWRSQCFLGLKHCDEENPCVLHDYWDRFREETLIQLSRVTLADVEIENDQTFER